MRPYSMDLRERVMRAVDDGELNQGEIAERFSVSTRWIRTLRRRRDRTGSIAPRPPGGGQPAKITGRTLERLEEAVREEPDATLEELRERCAVPEGVRASGVCVWRTLKRHGITRKKNRPAPPSGTRPRFGRGGPTGSGSRRTWPRSG